VTKTLTLHGATATAAALDNTDDEHTL
jgi:hypothetical protein